MAEHEGSVTRRRGPDLVTLVAGVLALLAAVSTIVGDAPYLPSYDPRWLLAGGAALLGVLLLVGSLRGRRR